MNTPHEFEWKFYRIGGLDQVTLRTADELRHIGELDPKLWVVLSLPIDSLRFDHRTLELVDADQDGRIRVPEVVAAVQWTVERLVDPASMAEGRDSLPLSFIREDTDEGKGILLSARRILAHLGKTDAEELSQQDTAEAVRNAERQLFNGDGVIPPVDELEDEVKAFIWDVMGTVGSVPDASGQPGISQALADKFLADVDAWLGWRDGLQADRHIWPLGDTSEKAYGLMQDMSVKMDDYFIRCDLVNYDVRSTDKVNAPDAVLEQLGGGALEAGSALMAELPLAHVEAGRPLPLLEGVNPAWRERLREFHDIVVAPVLGGRESLTQDDWNALKAIFAPYAAIMAQQPSTPVAALGEARLRELQTGKAAAQVAALIEEDIAAAPEVASMNDVERLVLFHRHLHRLLMNFVSFTDFYAPGKLTPFEIGTLYMDGRGCQLCLRVDSIDDHAVRSPQSYLCLAYCTCTRKDNPTPLNIVAAVTAGTQDRLTPGRHGVFVDREGQIWDATLVKLVDNPICIRTAMFAPYRRMAAMVTEQIEKFSTAKDASVTAGSAKALENLAGSGGKPAPFDIGKSVGIFAAIGLALGALGTALATIAASLLALRWWQFPLLIVGIFTLISGPSMLLAWLKLRKRALGPALDASGWAVNSRIPINFMLGHVLTDTAALPPNAARSLDDPFKKPGFWKGWMTSVLLVCFLAGCALGGWWAWEKHEEAGKNAAAVQADIHPVASAPTAKDNAAEGAKDAVAKKSDVSGEKAKPDVAQ